MLFDLGIVAAGMAKEFIGSLQTDSRALKTLAEAEAKKIAVSLEAIGQMFKDGDISEVEAQTLLEVQRAASETVFASLEGIGRVAAKRAVNAGLSGAATIVDGAIGLPLIKVLVGTGVV